MMEDYQQIESTMDGQPYKAGYHAATLRRYLWREHLGLLPAQDVDASKDPNVQPPNVAPNDIKEDDTYEFVKDPMSDQVWDMWTGNATKNLEMFRHLFRADPDDNSKSLLPRLIYFTPRICSGPRMLLHYTSHCGVGFGFANGGASVQSILSKTIKTSFPRPGLSRATCTTPICRVKRCGKSLIRSKVISSGCRWNF